MSSARREADRMLALTIVNVAFGDNKRVNWQRFVERGEVQRNQYHPAPDTPEIRAAKERIRATNEATRRRLNGGK